MIGKAESSARAKLADIVSITLDLPLERIDDTLSSETAESWDSIRHLTLILAVEDAFVFTFDERQISELTSFPVLLRAVEARIAS
jgi:acyl carrier protein